VVAPFQPAARLWVTPPVPGPYHPIELRQASGGTVAGGVQPGRRGAVRVERTTPMVSTGARCAQRRISLCAAHPGEYRHV